MRRTCPICRLNTTVRLDGKLRAHGYAKGSGKTEPCEGSYSDPDEMVVVTREELSGAIDLIKFYADDDLLSSSLVQSLSARLQ